MAISTSIFIVSGLGWFGGGEVRVGEFGEEDSVSGFELEPVLEDGMALVGPAAEGLGVPGA